MAENSSSTDVEGVELKGGTTHYGNLAVTFHWVTAGILLTLIPLGFLMQDAGWARLPLYRGHWVAGLMVLGATVLRIGWYFVDRRPDRLHDQNRLHHLFSSVTRFLLLLLLSVMLISGIWMSVQLGLAGIYLGLTDTALPTDFSHLQARWVHGVTVRLFLAILSIHIIAALYQQFVLKRNVFSRIWFGYQNDGENP